MKKIFCCFILVYSYFSFSQEFVSSFGLDLKRKNAVFQVVEEDKNKVSLFFNDSKQVRMISLDENLNKTDSLITDRPNTDYDDIIGYSISEDKYYLYWSEGKNKEIFAQCFDTKSKNVSTSTINLVFDKEKILKKITVNSVFYIINIVKNTSILHIYILKDGKLDKKIIDLTGKTFLTNDNQKSNLWEIVNLSGLTDLSLYFENISNETPPSLTISSSKKKVYVEQNKLYFTFDHNFGFTQLLGIDFDTFSAFQKTYTQPYMEPLEYDNPISNSFFINGFIVQLKHNSSRLIITCKDFEGNEIKTYSAFSGREIEFKNSDIIQENGSVKNTRILDKSDQLIRKINSLNSSLSCSEIEGKICLTIGAVSDEQNNNAMLIAGMVGGLSGALIGAAISSNYSMNNLNSYKNRKVVYINCLFDEQFNHIKGEVKSLPFDELRKFDEKNNWLSDKTIFKMNSNLYYGAYSLSEKKSTFYKF